VAAGPKRRRGHMIFVDAPPRAGQRRPHGPHKREGSWGAPKVPIAECVITRSISGLLGPGDAGYRPEEKIFRR